ncbi:MAG: HDOD domain-containing protein, partial [Burkholderiales bacterium]|nr:HDOD domain-containing protein [Burkholderiales bacterium]
DAPLILEEVLAAHPQALAGVRAVISRAYQAAVTARHFSALRHDMEAEEVTIAALLHDLAEMLSWCTAPEVGLQLERMLACHQGLRSAAAQRVVLGFVLSDLQLALAREWRLPRLLQSLMDDAHSDHPRVQTVRHCVALARHCAQGWYDPALPDDYRGLEKVVGLPGDQVRRALRQCAVHAARNWHAYGVRPAAAWIPLLPGTWPGIAQEAIPQSDMTRHALLARCLEQLSSAGGGEGVSRALVAVAFYALERALGLHRIWLGVFNPRSRRVEPAHVLMGDSGLLPGELGFEIGDGSLFDRLREKSQAVWFRPRETARLVALLPTHLQARLGAHAFYAMGLQGGGLPDAVLFADAGPGSDELDESRYNAFKTIALALVQALQKARN